MPSDLHEILLDLIKEAPSMLRSLLPEHADLLPASLRAQTEETETKQQTHLRADLALKIFGDEDAQPCLGLVVEAQLRKDPRKEQTWPHYVTGLHLKLERPVYLVVLTLNPEVTAWAKGPFDVGAMTLRPWVIGPRDIPPITDEARAHEAPELALLSGLAHCNEPVCVKIGLSLRKALDTQDHPYKDSYWDLLLDSLAEEFRQALTMALENYTPKSEWGRKHFAEGKAEGRTEKACEILLKQVELKFGPPTPEVTRKIEGATIEQLDRWALGILTAQTVEQLLEG